MSRMSKRGLLFFYKIWKGVPNVNDPCFKLT